MPQEQQLDVREIIPRERHPRIFNTFDAMKSGESFVLVNDHDPKPLYYQFNAERPEQFSWEYLEKGPETWRVRIMRIKSYDEDKKDGGCCGCCGG